MIISRDFYNFLKGLLLITAVFFIVFIVIGLGYYRFVKKYENKYFPGSQVAGIDLGGLNKTEAEEKLNHRIDFIQSAGITFVYGNKQATLDTLLRSAEADIAVPIIMFNIDKILQDIWQYPRTNNFLLNIQRRLFLWKNKINFSIKVNIKEDEVNKFLQEEFVRFSQPAQNAQLIIEKDKQKNIKFSVNEETYGRILDFTKAKQELRNNLIFLQADKIFLQAVTEDPQIYKEDCLNINDYANKIIQQAPLKLVYQDATWVLKQDGLLDLLVLKQKQINNKKIVFVGLDQDKTKEYLQNEIAPEINQEAVDAKFEVIDKRVKQFQRNKDGQELDLTDSARLIEKTVLAELATSTILSVRTISSKKSTREMEDLGIKEIIGTGHSNFKHSPANRRHNIQIGANSVNGSLIAPGEEFSLLKVLGKINKDTGYLPELVIKDGKTLPEYGGGLCQIGTTVFRGTIASGLPVTMRRNHSYRVSYYEPAGTDATIYDPWPDYKFKNDTAQYILIQSRIDGNDLYFDFWGTKDGRVASSTYPVIYNIKRPGPTKIIETLDLKPGVKKCTEHAHNGADAYFDYKVIYPNGDIKEERFKSHYSPWQAVCLLGVSQLNIQSIESNATTTDKIISTQ